MTYSIPPIVCIVEDETDILFLLRIIAQSSRIPCTVHVHQSGDTVLAFARKNRIALIMTDLNMQGITGFDIATQVKKDQPSCVVAIITAFATPENEQKAKEIGVRYFIPKPFRIEQIESMLHEVLQEHV